MLKNTGLSDTALPIVEKINVSANDSDFLEELEVRTAIRKRPGMYIGSTCSRGLIVLAREIIHAALQEYQLGFCKNIYVTIHLDGSLRIRDDGRAPELDYMLAALVEFPPKNLNPDSRKLITGYGFSIGGPMVAAALSSWLICEVQQKSRCWQAQCYAPLGKHAENWEAKHTDVLGNTGLMLHFLPDPAIFGATTWDSTALLQWLWEQVHLFPGLTITFTDEREGCEPQVICAPDGIRELLPWGLTGKTPIHPTIITSTRVHEGVQVELALSFIQEESTWRLYGCGIPLRDGGTPLIGLRKGLARTLGKLAGRKAISFQPEKARLGIAAVVSLWLDNPVFGAPTQDRLQNPEAEVAVARVVRDALFTHARNYPDEMQAILAAL